MGCGATRPSSSQPLNASTQNIPRSSDKKAISRTNHVQTAAEVYGTDPEEERLKDKHTELKNAIAGIRKIRVKLQTKVGPEHYELICTALVELLDAPYEEFDSKEQRQVLADYLSRIDLGRILVDYYVEILKDQNVNTCAGENVNLDEKAVPVVLALRSILWNYSDASVKLCEKLGSTPIFHNMLLDLNVLNKSDELLEENFTFQSAMGIIHNCAKASANVQILRDLKMVECLLPFLKREETEAKMVTVLTLALLLDEDKNYLLLADDTVFDFLIDLMSEAFNDRSHRCGGFSFEELMFGLSGLARNDMNKKLIMAKGALPLICSAIYSGNLSEKEAATKTLWLLAFDPDNKEKIQKDDKLIKALEKLKKGHERNLATQATGALWLIKYQDLELKQTLKRENTNIGGLTKTGKSEADAARGHIMISYNWAEQKVILQVRDELQRNGFIVWMDVDMMGGSTLQAMAEAVEDSAVVLMCMSEKYKDSPNCRTEAEYAVKLNKSIVPLLMQMKYQPRGWLGIILGTKLFFDFSGKYNFEAKFLDLVKELAGRGQSAEPTIVKSDVHVYAAPANMSKTVDQWSKEDLEDWLKRNNLTNNPQLRSLKGDQIKFLQKLSNRAPEFFYSYIEKKLKISELQDMMNFSAAVEKI